MNIPNFVATMVSAISFEVLLHSGFFLFEKISVLGSAFASGMNCSGAINPVVPAGCLRMKNASLSDSPKSMIFTFCPVWVIFPYFCVIILLLWVEKLQSKGEETVWKGFCILIRELIHPYESVSISLCNLRSTPLNVRSTSSNGGSTTLNGEIIRMRKQIHVVYRF